MTRRLVTGVRVTGPDGADVVVGPGVPPDWAVEQITNGAAWEDGGGEAGVLVLPDGGPGEAREDNPAPEVEGDGDGGVDYGSMTVAELKAEISARNDVREEADRIPTDGVKADLVAALEADDEQQ